MVFIKLRKFPSISSLLIVFTNRCQILSNDFTASIDMIIWLYHLWSVHGMNHISKALDVEPALHT